MVFIAAGFFEVAIESWPEWNLSGINPATLVKMDLIYLPIKFGEVSDD